jgi:hypothetical protein
MYGHAFAIAAPASLARWIATLAAGAWAVAAQAVPPSPVPNFYQHQAWLPATAANADVPAGRNLWEGWDQANFVANGGMNAALNEAVKNGKAGFSWQTSVVDALYPWTQFTDAAGTKPFANLFGSGDITAAGTWVTGFENAVLGVKAAFGNTLGETSINGYLNTRGFGPTINADGVALNATSFTVGADGKLSVSLAGRTEATPFTPLAAATQSFNNGWTAVMHLDSNPKPQPTLWWDTSFHAMAVAGVSGNQVLVADPDSVPRNAGNNNGGWRNFTTINAAPNLAVRNAAATASLAAAVTAVNANVYTNAQAAGPTPVPGVAGYTAANLYGSVTFDTVANKVNDIIAASNNTYGGRTSMTAFDVINTLAVTHHTLVIHGNHGMNRFVNTVDWTGLVEGGVKRIEVFPLASLTGTTFSFTEPGWTSSLATVDPFGGVWSGGIDLSLTPSGSALALGDTATLTFGTFSFFTDYNVFFQLADGDWGVQAFGLNGNTFGDQVDAVSLPLPEPATGLLFASGWMGLAFWVRRRQRRGIP